MTLSTFLFPSLSDVIDHFHFFIHLAEERQDQNAKRRKLEQQSRQNGFTTGPSPTLGLTVAPTAPNSTSNLSTLHPSLPQRPITYDFAANADSIGLGAAPTPQSIQYAPAAVQALAGSNHDVVANRRAIRMANMSAAQTLKAEISGLRPVKPDPPSPSKPLSAPVLQSSASPPPADDPNDVPGFGLQRQLSSNGAELMVPPSTVNAGRPETPAASDMDADGEPDTEPMLTSDEGASDGNVDNVEAILTSAKRKFEEGPGLPDDTANTTNDVVLIEEEDDTPADESALALKVNPDGTVEQEDTVKFV